MQVHFQSAQFSPMTDPSHELGCPGECAAELRRFIGRGLRESRAVDKASLNLVMLPTLLLWLLSGGEDDGQQVVTLPLGTGHDSKYCLVRFRYCLTKKAGNSFDFAV
ncbi:uncharacterized protein LOC114727833 [Neltuma alba]|uniref:uncharacterized protein LOC114727833 n=1 Tax=Neltuma alba TaxID=207710 RepID=UPI0010A4E93A|nr:uncharacterized protein LOC114727833 [Prosopis alba]